MASYKKSSLQPLIESIVKEYLAKIAANKQVNDFAPIALNGAENILAQSNVTNTTGTLPSQPLKDAQDYIPVLNADVASLQTDVTQIQIDVSDLQTDVADIKPLSYNNASTALIEGAELSINGGDPTLFDVAAGTIRIMDNSTDPMNPTETIVNFAGQTGITVTNLATEPITYVGIDSSGTVNQFIFPDDADLRSNALIGILLHVENTVIEAVTNQTFVPAVNPASTLSDFLRIVGTVNKSGNVFSPNGANLQINKSSGELFKCGIQTKSDLTTPNSISTASSTPITFVYVWRDGSGSYNTNPSQTLLNPDRYDDGTGGVTEPNGTVSTNVWTITRIYLSTLNIPFVVYGQATYATKAEAIDGIGTEAVDIAPQLNETILRCYLLSRGGASDLSDSGDAIFVEVGPFGDVSNRGISSSTTNLQQAYDNSPNPEIVTTNTNGPLQVVEGSGVGGDVFVVDSNAGALVLVCRANGQIAMPNLPTSSAGLSSGDIYSNLGILTVVP